jgi:hypothetical protein
MIEWILIFSLSVSLSLRLFYFTLSVVIFEFEEDLDKPVAKFFTEDNENTQNIQTNISTKFDSVEEIKEYSQEGDQRAQFDPSPSHSHSLMLLFSILFS